VSDTLKRLEKLERELAVGDEVEPRVYIVTFRGPGQEPSPEESEAMQREIDAARAAARKEGRNYAVVYWGSSQKRGEDTDGGEFRA
jgi:hypothetical protein